MAEKMKPGRDLDKLVAEAMGQKGRIALPYSTDIGAAWIAWEWLEKNNPWLWEESLHAKAQISLGRGDEKPSVFIHRTVDDYNFYIPGQSGSAMRKSNLYIPGESYPHAIALAVVEADKWLRK